MNKGKVGVSVKVVLGAWLWIGIGVGIGLAVSLMKSVLYVLIMCSHHIFSLVFDDFHL